MVFQHYALYPHMTVAENIGFTLKLRRRAKAEIAARVGAVAELLELYAYLDRLPRELSGGQQQRVALGRALIREPRVFLFDEPFSNLDAALRMRMRAEIKLLHSRLGVTSIFVTHDQEEALSISDRIAVMRQGRVEQFGTPEEIYARPATTYVARFIGSPPMDILRGEIVSENGSSVYRVGAATFPLPEPTVNALRAVLPARGPISPSDPSTFCSPRREMACRRQCRWRSPWDHRPSSPRPGRAARSRRGYRASPRCRQGRLWVCVSIRRGCSFSTGRRVCGWRPDSTLSRRCQGTKS